MLVKFGAPPAVELTAEQINQLAYVAWHAAYPGGYDGKPTEEELKQIARDALTPIIATIHR